MDKMDKYEEALQRAKELHDAGNFLMKQKMEIVFPELAESEDERMIKALETFINQPEIADKITFEARIGWLAWLEKQKKLFESGKGLYYYDGEKTTYCGYPATEENPYDFAMSQQEKHKESLHIPESCKENANSFTDDIIEVMSFQRGMEEGRKLEKQKEQKHPDGCFTCDEYKKGYEEGRRNGFTAGYNKAIKEVEQNVEQKPEEWSEEDERMLSRCVKSIESSKQFADTDTFKKAKDKEIDWLKSLRPSWKPSEDEDSKNSK